MDLSHPEAQARALATKELARGVAYAAGAKRLSQVDLPRNITAPRHSRGPMSPVISKKVAFGRIIKTFVRDGREYQLHATKGWRSFRA